MRSSFSMSLLYHAYVYFGFLILACTIYILASYQTSKKGDKGMKALTVEKAQEIRAGKGHYHWICRDWANFTSKAYSSYAAAGAAADAHVAKYPAHADKVSVFYCEKSSCQ